MFIIQINCSKENAQISEKNTVVNYISNSENTNQPDESTTAEIITPLSNDISKMKSLFEAFDGVTTSSDSDYFYISSNGIPSHNMMEGITNWQQQFPINQEYNGTNSWSIPVNP